MNWGQPESTFSEEILVLRSVLRPLSVLALLSILPAGAMAQQKTVSPSVATAQLRETVRRYDDALRRADSAAVEKFWATEYTFINPRGERVTRAGRLANLRAGRTALDSLVHAPEQEQIQLIGDVAVYQTVLTLRGRYSGTAQQGRFRASVVWIRRDGRWQQVLSQMTPILGP
jgi:ketosteroid isomerase-like protein